LKLGLRPVAPGFSPARLGGCRPKGRRYSAL